MPGKRRCSAATISAVSSTDSVVWVMKARAAPSGTANALRLLRVLHQGDGARFELAHGAHHLRVAGMADQQEVAAARRVVLGLAVDLADQRAGGVEVEELPPRRLGRHALGHAVGGEHHRRVVRHLVQLLDENGALALQALHHEAVVDDLVAHIDRGAVLADRLLDDLDGAVHPGAEAARAGKQDVQASRVVHRCRFLLARRGRAAN